MVALELGRLEGAITRAALDPAAWQGVTDALVEAFPGTKAGLIGYHAAEARGIPAAYSGYDPSFRPSYETHYSRVIPQLGRRLTLPVGRVVSDREIVSEEELLRSEFYNDWLRPQGDVRHGAIVVLRRDPGQAATFAARVEQHVAERMLGALMHTMRAACPLMQHALAVNRMTLGLRLDAALLRNGVEPNEAAVLLLGAQGSILYANARAEAQLAEGSLIQNEPFGRLRFRDADAMERLAMALDPRGGRRVAAFRIRGSKALQEVRLLPVTPEVLAQVKLASPLHAPAPRLLLVLRPVPTPTDAASQIAPRLGLTRAEAEVAIAIGEGAALAEVAEARGVSIHTVRQQVKSALSKTGGRRQSDLVRTVLALMRAH
jgi:DNA-binding CsgD family transcriptional regulator